MIPPPTPQQRKGPEQNFPPLAAADSTGRDKTSPPQKQRMAAEGAVTPNRSKKDRGAAVVPTSQRQGQSKDNISAGGMVPQTIKVCGRGGAPRRIKAQSGCCHKGYRHTGGGVPQRIRVVLRGGCCGTSTCTSLLDVQNTDHCITCTIKKL